ncbi:response regulator [Paludisphaera borealis]|uniref:Putative transcriptional regulatory protein TcrX n=1 Tax=Paludisphaera borealis TaxID=1387353 RepID=A0A1U7CU11_9BACT|nr:response regulator [Paludisphaera borealis]APW62437.1 putative transcriptional regulatory protein TcrX [Paludisphaera borealis]
MASLTTVQAARVLIVDDNRDTADTTAMLLRIQGYDVAVAYDGRSAISTAKRYDPDVVLLDLSLPDIDGYAVAESLQKDGMNRASFIALSGHGPDDRSWEQRHFVDYLVKPVEHETLVSLLLRVQAQKQV